MHVLSENGKSLIEAGAMFVSALKDQKNKSDDIIGYRVLAKGSDSPNPITVKSFLGDNALEEAKAYVKKVADNHAAEY